MEVEAGLDELLPVKKHLAPSWGDSLCGSGPPLAWRSMGPAGLRRAPNLHT